MMSSSSVVCAALSCNGGKVLSLWFISKGLERKDKDFEGTGARFFGGNEDGGGLGRSTVAHFARKVRGGEYCGSQVWAKNPIKSCPRALVMFATCSWLRCSKSINISARF